jgi:hypothetical protein
MALQRLLWAVFATALFLTPARAAYDVGDIICESSTTTGTGTLNLAGAVTNYARFVSQITSGSSVNYHITASDGTLETGVGVFTDAGTDTLTRVAYWSTDGSGAELTLPAGTHTVCLGPTTQMYAGMKGFQLYTDDAGAVGGVLPFWHDSASSANGDIAADIQAWGGADDEKIGSIRMEVDDGATTTEDTQWQFVLRSAGADLTAMALAADGTGAFAGLKITDINFGTNAFPALLVRNADDGSSPVFFSMFVDSASPAGGDLLPFFQFRGRNSAAEDISYTGVSPVLTDPTDGAEDAKIVFDVISAGASVAALSLGDGGDHKFLEAAANGGNYKALAPSAAITADTTCTFENDANFIPDSCVGDGSDASDGRLKTSLKPAGDVGKMLDGIKIYDYEWTANAPEASEFIRKGKRGVGPVAQELFNINPDWVGVGGENPVKDPWTWKPEKVVPYLIVEVQNLRKRLANSACYGIKLGSACIGVSM